MDRIQRIDDLFSQWKQGLPRGQSSVPERALDLFAENPFWTVGGLADRLSVAFTTAQRAIDRLEAAGIVAQSGRAGGTGCIARRQFSMCWRSAPTLA